MPSSGSIWTASGRAARRRSPRRMSRPSSPIGPPPGPPVTTVERIRFAPTLRTGAGRLSTSQVGRLCGRSVGGDRRSGEVEAPAETVDDPVEVALAQALALGFRHRRPAAMLVADRRQVDRYRPTGWPILAFVAEDEAPPDIEVAVEPEMLVER